MKERFKDAFTSFFISVTLIDAAMMILGLLLRPDQQFGYEVFLYPLIYGLIGMIPTLIITTDKELTVGQVLLRKGMQMLLIMVLLLAFMFAGKPMDTEQIPAAAGVAVSVAVIYVLVSVIEWMLDLRTAKGMTEDLLKYQQRTEMESPK